MQATHPGRRTQQERRDEARAALLQAAAELVVESGIASLTLATVGARAGYSRGLVTHHFGTKQALVDELVVATQSAFLPEVAAQAPGLDRLLAVVEAYIAALGRLGTRDRAFLVLWAEAGTRPELTGIFRERDEMFRAAVRADVTAGIEDTTVRADADPDAVAVSLVGQLRGMSLQRMLDPHAVRPERLGREVADQWWRSLAATAGSGGRR